MYATVAELCLLGLLAPTQDVEATLGYDPIAIDWVLPGDFELARRRSLEERRLLLVKGVSFGIDELGAKCATKGDW